MRKIAYIFIGIFLLLAMIIIIILQTSPQTIIPPTVTFTVTQSDLSISVHRKDSGADSPTHIATFSKSTALQLTQGDYYYVVTGERTAPEAVNFKVPDQTTFRIDPDYSSIYLAGIRNDEVESINQVIETRYAKIANDYIIHPGKLYKQGQWYATLITNRKSNNDTPLDEYRIVLQKQNDQWVIITTPEISLSVLTFPEVPKDILSDINAITIDSLEAWSRQSSLQ